MSKSPSISEKVEDISGLQTEMKKTHPLIKTYISTLEKENARLQTKMIKLEAKHLSEKNRLLAKIEEAEKNKINFVLNKNEEGLINRK